MFLFVQFAIIVVLFYLSVNCFFGLMFVRGLNDDLLGRRAVGDQKDQEF